MNTPQAYPQKNLGLLFAGATALCWSMLAILLKYALSITNSSTIVWSRMSIAFLILFSFLIIKDRSIKKVFEFKWSTIFAGLFLAINYFGYMKGIELTTASNAQVMIQMAPTLLIFIGIFYFKEKLTIRQFSGVALAIFGFYVFYQSQIKNLITSSSQLISGNLWILLAAITWALFSALQKKSSHSSLNHFNIIVYLTAAITLSVKADILSYLNFDLFEIFVLFTLGLNTALAYGCFGLALKLAPASQVSLIIILNPLITLAILHLFNIFNINFIEPEIISLQNIIGASLVVTGVGLAVIKSRTKKITS